MALQMFSLQVVGLWLGAEQQWHIFLVGALFEGWSDVKFRFRCVVDEDVELTEVRGDAV